MALAPCCTVFGDYHVNWLLLLRWGEILPPFNDHESWNVPYVLAADGEDDNL